MLGQIDGLVRERRNSIANAPELRLSCTNPLRYWISVVCCLDIQYMQRIAALECVILKLIVFGDGVGWNSFSVHDLTHWPLGDCRGEDLS